MNILEARRRTLGKGVYKKTVEGNPAIAQGSLARMYPGITMQGWTEQDGTPTPEAPVPIVSAGKYNEETQKYEYRVKLNGANLFNPEKLTGGEIVEYNGVQCYKYTDNLTNFTYIDDFAKNTQYCFSVMILSSEGNEEKIVDIKIWYTDGTTTLIKSPHNQLANIVSSANKTVDKITGGDNWSVTRYINLSITTLGIGTEPLPYQPYKEQTVHLTSDRPLTKWDKLEKRNGQWGWVYKSAEIVLDGSEDENWKVTASSTYTFIIDINGAMFINSYCDRYICMPASWVSNNFGVYSDNGYDTKFFRPPSADVETVGQWKTFLSQNPLTVVCETAEETFVPLSESEQEAMNALHTFRPTTVLSNDAGCNMELTYKTKKSLEVTT